jgi:hypothetical protein
MNSYKSKKSKKSNKKPGNKIRSQAKQINRLKQIKNQIKTNYLSRN